jgi:dipeptidyl aminopeptidase/acylaminoacyl peptidase
VLIFHRLASEGFTVLAPLYRGSDGGEGRDEMGGADVNDLMNILPVAKSLMFIDTNNLFMYGQSRGGMMTFQAIRKEFPINAAAVYGAFTDLDQLLKSDPQTYQPLIKTIWLDFDSRKDEILRTRSVIRWCEKITAPLLIMHGGADQDVNPTHSLNLALQLQRLGHKYELVIYADDNHILSHNQEDRDRRAISWFRRHLKK